jgi:hypothetical protein
MEDLVNNKPINSQREYGLEWFRCINVRVINLRCLGFELKGLLLLATSVCAFQACVTLIRVNAFYVDTQPCSQANGFYIVRRPGGKGDIWFLGQLMSIFLI